MTAKEIKVLTNGIDIQDRPYIILQPDEMPVKDGKPLFAQFVLYWDEKAETWRFYCTTKARRISGDYSK